jgi:large subunit ribosomal protein L24
MAAKLKIRAGDRVKVIRGNHKGEEGVVLRVEPDRNRVVIEGVNLRKRHKKPSQANPEGGIVQFEAPVHVSNVMVIDPSTGEPTRVKAAVAQDGTKTRVAVRSGKTIPSPRA